MELATKFGRRQSTYISYVEPILETRKKLKIITYATARKIIFPFNTLKRQKRAVGIKYVRHGYKFKAYASKEVIVSAGVYATPMLMFRSGLGPSDMLKDAGVAKFLQLIRFHPHAL